jgi:hypothetical protein
MKKFTLSLFAIAITISAFAQITKLDASNIERASNHQELMNNEKSAWIGGGFDYYYTAAVTGDEFFIVGSDFAEATSGNQITKVKFYHELGTVTFTSGPVTFDNTQYTIKIYENPTLGGALSGSGLYDLPIGTPVYTESVTLSAAESGAIYEHTLSTPYDINSNEFWVSVTFDNGKGAMRLAGPAAANEEVYWMTYNYSGTNYAVTTDFGEVGNPAFYALGISLFVDDGGAYVEQSDLATKFINIYPSPTSYITTLTITETEDLIIYPVTVNNGPDATSADATYSATINGVELIAATTLDLSTTPLPFEYYQPIFLPDGSYTITAAELDALTLPLTFDVCFTVTYSGTDPNTDNDLGCITVTRGELPETTCDLESVFMTSNSDPTPIATEITLGANDDLSLFPAVANNGPDEANTTGAVSITVDGVEMINQDVDFTGLTNGSIAPLTPTGYNLTAAQMTTAGLTGTFDVCLSVSYNSVDPNADNDELCITITRETVNVESNLTSTISVYPNPANNVITVANAENSNIVVLNMVGEVVASIENASANQTIDITNLASGSYFVRVNSEVFKVNVVK